MPLRFTAQLHRTPSGASHFSASATGTVRLCSPRREVDKERYGTAFLSTVNLDSSALRYFPDLGRYVDGGYYQNAFFRWDGSAVIDGTGLSTSKREFRNPSIEFLRAQGLAVLNMEHLGNPGATES